MSASTSALGATPSLFDTALLPLPATTSAVSINNTTSTLQSCNSFPSTTSADDQNLEIFKLVDLSKKASIDRHFKIIKGKGILKPPSSYIGVSENDYALCFEK